MAYENSKGKMLCQSFYHDGFKRKKIAGAASCDTIPRTVTITGGRNSLMERLKLQVCELCGATDKLEMHHVRKLKDLKGKSDWEKRMIARRRKTLPVCPKCHARLGRHAVGGLCHGGQRGRVSGVHHRGNGKSGGLPSGGEAGRRHRSRHPAACRKAEKQGITKKQNVSTKKEKRV